MNIDTTSAEWLAHAKRLVDEAENARLCAAGARPAVEAAQAAMAALGIDPGDWTQWPARAAELAAELAALRAK